MPLPLPLLHMFAATDATTATPDADCSDFPGEHPTDKDLSDWLDSVLPKLRRAYGALMRGETPQHLLQYEGGADDLTGLERIDTAAPAPAGMNPARIMQYNRQVDVERAGVASRRRSLVNGLRTEKNNLAQWIISALRKKAPLRLKALKRRHAVVGHDECHDGVGMINELIALRGSIGQHEEVQDHDREVERMRDEPLPDGCSVDDYAYRVNELIRDHVGHLERPLEGAALGKFIVRLMPKANSQEGRAIIRRCSTADLEDLSAIVAECSEIVNESSHPSSRVAAAAARSAGLPPPVAQATIVARTTAASAYGAMPVAAAAPTLSSPLEAFASAVADRLKGTGTLADATSGGAASNRAERRAARKATAAAAAVSAGATSAAARAERGGKLPEGQLCAERTCTFVHVGKPCYRAPWTKLDQLPEKMRTNRSALEKFNAGKEANVRGPNAVCDRSRLVLYPLPAPKPAKSAATYDGAHDDTLDGLSNALRPTDLFYGDSPLPSNPAVLMSPVDLEEELRLPALTLRQPFGSALLSGAKTLESRATSALASHAGSVVAVRYGRREWDPADGVPSLPSSWSPSPADGLVHGVVRLQGTTSRREATDCFGTPYVAARVGLPLESVGAYVTVVTDPLTLPKPLDRGSGATWRHTITYITATRREWGEAVWAAVHSDPPDPQLHESSEEDMQCRSADEESSEGSPSRQETESSMTQASGESDSDAQLADEITPVDHAPPAPASVAAAASTPRSVLNGSLFMNSA